MARRFLLKSVPQHPWPISTVFIMVLVMTFTNTTSRLSQIVTATIFSPVYENLKTGQCLFRNFRIQKTSTTVCLLVQRIHICHPVICHNLLYDWPINLSAKIDCRLSSELWCSTQLAFLWNLCLRFSFFYKTGTTMLFCNR